MSLARCLLFVNGVSHDRLDRSPEVMGFVVDVLLIVLTLYLLGIL